MNWFLKLFGVGTTPPAPTPPPVVDPEPGYEVIPPPAPEVPAPTGLTLETAFQWRPGLRQQPIPFIGGTTQRDASWCTGRVWATFRITNNGPDTVFIKPSSRGPNNPKVDGIPKSGKRLVSQESVTVKFSIGPVTSTKKSGNDTSEFGLHAGNTQIVQGGIQVWYGK